MTIQFVPGQQKNTLATLCKLQPDETCFRKSPLKGRLAQAYLDDEDSIIGEEAACIMQYSQHRIQTVIACCKTVRRFMRKFRCKPVHLVAIDIRWIADDDVVGRLRSVSIEAGKKICLQQTDPGLQSETLHIYAGNRKRILVYIGRIDRRFRESEGQGNRDTAAAGAEIQGSMDFLRLYPGREVFLDQFGER